MALVKINKFMKNFYEGNAITFIITLYIHHMV